MEQKAKLRVFLDSNVILSGLHSDKGSPGIIIDYFVKGKIKVIISRKVLSEVILVIKLKLPHILSQLRNFLINFPPEIVKDPDGNEIKKFTELINKDDAVILAAAITSNPDYLVTGDKHFFEDSIIKEKLDLKIVTPSEFLEIIGR